MVDVRIDARHDPAALGEILQKEGRLQVPNFFPADVAEKLYGLLRANPTWFTAYNEGENFYEVPQAEVAGLSPAQQQQFWRVIQKGAREGFQYFFQQYYISEAVQQGRETGHPLHFMHDFVNSEPVLEFMRTLTGEPKVRYIDSFASQYVAGNFLTRHDDTHATDDRVAAYVISMTKDWKADWGGNLVFYDEDENITGGFKPTFNSLNIFLVPQPHAVTVVSPFAGDRRTSFLGWVKR
ncbi:2OG-Fe(II) oxygenase [Kordiimonas lipolytica]|uniref:2OG-Fe(II) oxygenase n=1 Tax=Kordiimonas lipolytica TaxID=1662421 RepID=A0ABV8UES7_9PROT|nr:2OG-Fe(II) oxygenase family protein [Kordiimonas lipolytica]